MKKTNDSDQTNVVIKELLLKVYALRFFYIVCIVAFLATAFLYNKYSRRVYENNTTISPVEDDRSSILYSSNYFQGLGGYTPGRPIENDISNLRSFALVSSTISSLNLEVGYFNEKSKLFKQITELYSEAPFYVTIDKSHLQPINTKFYLYFLNDSTYRLIASQKEVALYNYIDKAIVKEHMFLNVDTISRFNKTITNRNFKLAITRNKNISLSKIKQEGSFYFELYDLDNLTKSYLKRLYIGPLTATSSIINIQFSGENNEKITSFLNKYVDSYFTENLDKKNKIANSTISFIDSQISEISDSLGISESKLKNYRSANQVMDLSVQGTRLYDQLSQIETERANLEVQERYYNYVLNYFKTNRDISGIAPPSSMNVADPIMNQLVSDLFTLNSQRAAILSNNNEKNLFLEQIENKIRLQISVITENVKNNLNTLSIAINELNYRSDKLSREISNIPRTELSMVNMQRKYTLNNEIYTYLLQKRSEAAITLASNYPDYELLEPAREITSQTKKPREKVNYLIAFFFAFLIPTMFLIIRDLFNDKIQSVSYVEHLINRSLLGIIPTNDHKSESVVIEYPGSSIAEAFRNIRGSLFFKLKDQTSKIVLITSSQPRDGKSFFSYNLAHSIATVGYKTILIDADLHRPTLHTKFDDDNTTGLSTYMIKNISIEGLLRKTSIDSLSFVPAGPLLPNPSELIEAGVLDDLINSLKKKYEYIIIDTTPVGIVSDAILLMKYASEVLLVCRNGYTRKDVFSSVIDSINNHNFDNYDVVFNDQNLKESTYGKYTSYYKKDVKA